jgi:peptidoglycan hydrolase CwlO-like protein
MLGIIRRSIREGLNRIKWMAAFLADRIRAETLIARHLYESSRIEDRIDELYRDIGRRICELDEKGERVSSDDFVIKQAINEIKGLRAMIRDHKEKARELSKLPE